MLYEVVRISYDFTWKCYLWLKKRKISLLTFAWTESIAGSKDVRAVNTVMIFHAARRAVSTVVWSTKKHRFYNGALIAPEN